ncbi:PE domain-containing protein [Pseudonocardia sp. H11422]|uniref:PE domain-containing protein n=1 Tax=Pseudonocardia sp. H11422 TaxID=2835866 RepID=UPI001BDC7CE5|nr:PE domain-containing protein [Pseudonocardia sp. H11422]
MTQPRLGPIDPVLGRGPLPSERDLLLAVRVAGPVGEGAVPGTLYIDPERAQACIEELGRIVADLRSNMITVRQGTFTPPGRDEVSLNMARNAVTMAQRAEKFVGSWANQIEATRDALRKQLDAYQAAERSNTARHL